MIQFVPSLTIVAHLPAVADNIAVPAEPPANGTILLDADITVLLVIVFIKNSVPVEEDALGNVKVQVPALFIITQVFDVVIDAEPTVIVSTGRCNAFCIPTNPVKVFEPANVCVPVVTTPLAVDEALAIVIDGVVVPFATDIGKVPVTFVTVPVFVALNVPLDKDNPVPKVI